MTDVAGSIVLVRVVPGAPRAGVVGLLGDALRIRVTSPPVDGRATAEVCAVLADALGLAGSDVRLVSGASSRTKRIWTPLSVREVGERLGVDLPTGDRR